MSVLIKGMTRPKNCFECHLTKWIDDGQAGCVADDKIHNASRPNDCPLIEVTEPHGDLIDRDAFRADFSMGENCDKCGIELKRCEYDRIYTKMDFCGWLDDAPVIIEAEGSEDDEQIQADH